MEENFNSIDKLMAFGMSAAIATQMIQTMNQSICSMRLPGEMPPGTGRPAVEYYVVVDGTQAGPLSEDNMRTLIESGRIDGATMAWTRGLAGWMHMRSIPALNKLLLLAGK